MHGFVSYRRFGRARSLRNDQAVDRAVCVLGLYVATELGLSVVRLPYSSLPVVGSDTCTLPWIIDIWFEDLDINFVVAVFDPNDIGEDKTES
ncbi:hypothetical protein Bca4012_043681 [Brassica carinata]